MSAVSAFDAVHPPSMKHPSLLRRIFASFVAAKAARDTADALYRLSDRELDDIGLTRGDIPARAIKSSEQTYMSMIGR